MAFKLEPGVDKDRNLIICQVPDAIVFRLYEVLASWKKNTIEIITFVKDNILNFLNKNKHHVYMLQLLTELREQSLKDQRIMRDCPVVEQLSTNIVPVAKSARNYVTWKFNIHGNVDFGSAKEAHNKLARLMAFEGYRSGKLSFYLYHEVEHVLKAWKQQGMRLILYSSMACDEIWSGKNLLGYTSYGDLQNLFDYYIDSTKYPVYSDNSYQMILQKYGLDSKILFITADIKEARYAQKNNINPMIMMREDSLADISNKYFDDIPCIIELAELKFAKESELKKIAKAN